MAAGAAVSALTLPLNFIWTFLLNIVQVVKGVLETLLGSLPAGATGAARTVIAAFSSVFQALLGFFGFVLGGLGGLAGLAASTGLLTRQALLVYLIIAGVCLAVLLTFSRPRFLTVFTTGKARSRETGARFMEIVDRAVRDFGDEFLEWVALNPMTDAQLERLREIASQTLHYGIRETETDTSLYVSLNARRQIEQLALDQSDRSNKDFVEDYSGLFYSEDAEKTHEDKPTLEDVVRARRVSEAFDLWVDRRKCDPVKVVRRSDIEPIGFVEAFDRFRILFPAFVEEVVWPRLVAYRHAGMGDVIVLADHARANGGRVVLTRGAQSAFTADEIRASEVLVRAGHALPAEDRSLWYAVVSHAVRREMDEFRRVFTDAVYAMREATGFYDMLCRAAEDTLPPLHQATREQWLAAVGAVPASAGGAAGHLGHAVRSYERAFELMERVYAARFASPEEPPGGAPGPDWEEDESAVTMRRALELLRSGADLIAGGVEEVASACDVLMGAWDGVHGRVRAEEGFDLEQLVGTAMALTDEGNGTAPSGAGCEAAAAAATEAARRGELWAEYAALLNALNCSVYMSNYLEQCRDGVNRGYLNRHVIDNFHRVFLRALNHSYLRKSACSSYTCQTCKVTFSNVYSVASLTASFWSKPTVQWYKTRLRARVEAAERGVVRDLERATNCGKAEDDTTVSAGFVPTADAPVDFSVPGLEEALREGAPVRVRLKGPPEADARLYEEEEDEGEEGEEGKIYGTYRAGDAGGGDVLELRAVERTERGLAVRLLAPGGTDVVVGVNRRLILSDPDPMSQRYQHDKHEADGRPVSGVFYIERLTGTDVKLRAFYQQLYVGAGFEMAEGRDDAAVVNFVFA